MTTPTIAMQKPITAMTEEELRYTWAYCDGEARRVVENTPSLDRFERRRAAAEQELNRRRTK